MLLTDEFAETCADNHAMRQNVLVFLIESLRLLPKDYARYLHARDDSMHRFLLYKNKLLGHFLHAEELWAELDRAPLLLQGKPDRTAIRRSEEWMAASCACMERQLREML